MDWAARVSAVESKQIRVDFFALECSGTGSSAATSAPQLAEYCQVIDRLSYQGMASKQAAAVMRQCGGDLEAVELWVASCSAAGLSYIPSGSSASDTTETWVWESSDGHCYIGSSLQEMQSIMQESPCTPHASGIMAVIRRLLASVTQEMQQEMSALEAVRQEQISDNSCLSVQQIMNRLAAGSGIAMSRLVAIEEVINPTLWGKYCSCKAAMPIANEQWLFHGSGVDNISRIVAEGFDLQLAQPSGSCGAGVYFAPHSSTSHTYVAKQAFKAHVPLPSDHNASSKLLQDAKHQGLHVMLLCTVLLGKAGPNQGAGVRRAPSGTDSVSNSNMSVVYNAGQAYPRYIIMYK